MSKQILLAVLWVLIASCSMAYTAPQPRVDAHKAHDDKIRECRKRGAEQGLVGETLRSFVAQCTRS